MTEDPEKEALSFIMDIDSGAKVTLLYHGDGDGVCSAVMVYKCLQRRGISNINPLPLERGENPFSERTTAKINGSDTDFLVVLDSGSRRGTFHNIRSLVIDHHVPDSVPEVEVFFNTWVDKTNRITSEAVFDLVKRIIPEDDIRWYSLTGTGADAGLSKAFSRYAGKEKKYGNKEIQECISLINASRRHCSFRIAEVFNLLVRSTSPSMFIAAAKRAGIDKLREELKLELKKNLKIAPVFSSFFVLFQLNSPHQIHPLIASIWSVKLNRYVVIAANWGYLPGKVSFSMRTESGKDLLVLLKKYRKKGEEIGFGHSKATGGIVKEEVFRDFLRRLGFKPKLLHPKPPDVHRGTLGSHNVT